MALTNLSVLLPHFPGVGKQNLYSGPGPEYPAPPQILSEKSVRKILTFQNTSRMLASTMDTILNRTAIMATRAPADSALTVVSGVIVVVREAQACAP